MNTSEITTREENLKNTSPKAAADYLMRLFSFGGDSYLEQSYPSILRSEGIDLGKYSLENHALLSSSLYAVDSFLDSIHDMYKMYHWTSKEYKAKMLFKRARESNFESFFKLVSSSPETSLVEARNLINSLYKELSSEIDDEYKQRLLSIIFKSAVIFIEATEGSIEKLPLFIEENCSWASSL